MTIVERVITGAVTTGTGLYVVAVALSPIAGAAPLVTGGAHACLETSAGEVSAVPAAAGGGAAVVPAAGCAAPIADMAAGVPMALPGPLPIAPPVPVVPPVPLGAPLPIAPPVPLGAPLPVAAPLPAAAPLPVGAPLVDMAGGFSGKGDPIRPPADGAPVAGQPIMPGPGA